MPVVCRDSDFPPVVTLLAEFPFFYFLNVVSIFYSIFHLSLTLSTRSVSTGGACPRHLRPAGPRDRRAHAPGDPSGVSVCQEGFGRVSEWHFGMAPFSSVKTRVAGETEKMQSLSHPPAENSQFTSLSEGVEDEIKLNPDPTSDV